MTSLAQPAPRIFVSHSHHDNNFCRDYVNGLRERGASVWYDDQNLGWGALRATIEKEMPQCQHFVAILSPAAVASEWVNTEIDAALELLKDRTLQTLTFVLAEPCVVPLLLRRWKRIEGTDGAAVSVLEAIARTAAIIGLGVQAPPSGSAPSALLPAHLAQLGFEVRRSGAVEYIIPPLCAVPAGEFLLGSDPEQDSQAFGDEKPQHCVTLPAFQIARFPVTVAEYACFVRDGGSEPRRWDDQGKVVDWQTQLRRLDHPIVCVTWHNAVAYAAWLVKRTGQPWRLPTEAEWEKAARWDPAQRQARIYPWGDAFDKTCCNTSESGIGDTTPVGTYPSGAGPCGAQDMAGNVWEWTSSLYKPYPYRADDGRERVDSTDSRALRGGSWYNNARSVRAACRNHSGPGGFVGCGFRLVLAAPGSS